MKHLVDIDPALLSKARKAAGTKTIKATVEAALKELHHRHLMQRHFAKLRKFAPEIRKHLADARSPRFG